jgi:L-alanine-DL-glutamate epimerase-like enolase superfamily enzyme
MTDTVQRIESFVVSIPRETPYLGPLALGERVNEKGYILRKGNRTLYPTQDRSILVKVTTADGAVGWGETYGICAPKAVISIIEDLLAPEVVGRDPFDVTNIYEDLYDMMHVRGFFGGFYGDALAAVDIALWDVCGKITNLPLSKLLGGQRYQQIPAYVSGLPRATIGERCELAREWQAHGFRGFKFAAVVSHEGVVTEMEALRRALGADADIMVDMHWKHTAAEACAVIQKMSLHGLYFAEAPCAPEDIDGLAEVSAKVTVPIAAGEEWRTVYEARQRLQRRACSIIQPEMGHTGVTQFVRIAQMAQAFHCRVIPHASIGVGIFQAASLHAYSTLVHAPWHEYQHSVFDRNLQFVETTMRCRDGFFRVPEGPGLGVAPADSLWQYRVE